MKLSIITAVVLLGCGAAPTDHPAMYRVSDTDVGRFKHGDQGASVEEGAHADVAIDVTRYPDAAPQPVLATDDDDDQPNAGFANFTASLPPSLPEDCRVFVTKMESLTRCTIVKREVRQAMSVQAASMRAGWSDLGTLSDDARMQLAWGCRSGTRQVDKMLADGIAERTAAAVAAGDPADHATCL